MPALSIDQILMATLSGSVVLLTTVIKFSMSGILRRIDTLESTVKDFAEKVMALGFSDKATTDRINRLESDVETLKETVCEVSEIVALTKHAQDRCRTCSPRV
jgi:uncharacterized protein YoxC